MSENHPAPRAMSRWRVIIMLGGVCASAVLYTLAAVGSHGLPYPEKISLAHAFGFAVARGWDGLFVADFCAPALLMVCAMFACLAAYLVAKNGAARLTVAAVAIFLPVLATDPVGALLAPLFGPPSLIAMLSGSCDGEDYGEGFMVLGPLGLWCWLWAWAALGQALRLWRARRERRAHAATRPWSP